MNIQEFNKTARKTETAERLTVDVRPFRWRQSEAVDSYLCGIMMAVEIGLFGCTKPITLICDSNMAFSDRTKAGLQDAKQQGVMVQIQQV